MLENLDRLRAAVTFGQPHRPTRDGTALGFINSIESRERRVRALYLDLLGRGPDAGGVAFWADVLLRTGDDVGLAVELAASDEYFARA